MGLEIPKQDLFEYSLNAANVTADIYKFVEFQIGHETKNKKKINRFLLSGNLAAHATYPALFGVDVVIPSFCVNNYKEVAEVLKNATDISNVFFRIGICANGKFDFIHEQIIK